MFLFNEPFIMLYQNIVVVDIVIVRICKWLEYYFECSLTK